MDLPTTAAARDRAVATFHATWSGEPDVLVRAPGRVNLIGDHTDHQEGFVLPMAVDRDVWIAARASAEPRVEVVSAEESGVVALDVAPSRPPVNGWGAYVEGMLWALTGEGLELCGWQGALASDVPVGAGLSSSAALELAVGLAACAVSRVDAPAPTRLAQLAQRAENDWVGMNCGIMDQLSVARGRAGHALKIDCRSLQVEEVPLPSDLAVLVLDTMTRRELATSAYNERRAECAAAAAAFGVNVLRDVDIADLANADLPDPVGRRARHVVTENARVQAASAALSAGDPARFGAEMAASHASLRNDYEVSTSALDAIVAAAASQPGCHGARLTGAGFGGCAVALVRGDAADAIAAAVTHGYQVATGLTPTVTVCRAADGAALVTAP